MSATEVFIKGLQAATGNDLFPDKFWRSYPEKSTHTFQDALDKYAEYYQTLNPAQQQIMVKIFVDLIKALRPDDLLGEEVKSIQAFVKKILDDANIPAFSMSWHQANISKKFAVGVTDTSNPKPVDNATLFQASSLSKPVSAAIVLDLMEQNNWNSNTLLADLSDYGPPELKRDPRYRELTIGMVLGQCSGLPNLAASEDEKKFMDTPGLRFNYSGLAFDFLKEVIEKKLQKSWETLAQEFFVKAGMQNSTFKQLPASHLHGKRQVAHGHKADGTPGQVTFPLNSPEIPAGSLLTTANDFMIFLQYCYNNKFLKSKLLTGSYKLNKNFPIPNAESQIQWGLGMGIYRDKEKTIAFHWGNNTGWNSFCAINIENGDAVACFVNSDNRCVIQQLVESVVGEMSLLFDWLCYSNFKAEKAPNSLHSITTLFPLIRTLTENVDLKKSLSAIQSLEQKKSKKQSFTSIFSQDDLAIQTAADEKRKKEYASPTDKKTTDDNSITYYRPSKK